MPVPRRPEARRFHACYLPPVRGLFESGRFHVAPARYGDMVPNRIRSDRPCFVSIFRPDKRVFGFERHYKTRGQTHVHISTDPDTDQDTDAPTTGAEHDPCRNDTHHGLKTRPPGRFDAGFLDMFDGLLAAVVRRPIPDTRGIFRFGGGGDGMGGGRGGGNMPFSARAGCRRAGIDIISGGSHGCHEPGDNPDPL